MTHTNDVVLIGGGIMSATLATLLHQLDPNLSLTLIEQLPDIASESSFALNNAGTGHGAYCELNYTSENQAGEVEIEKAVGVNRAFEQSLQLWASLVERGMVEDTKKFINQVPHMSFVWGAENVAFLKNRYNKMSQHHFFNTMRYTEDTAELEAWSPLVVHGRQQKEIAATRVEHGADVNFGQIARDMISALQQQGALKLQTNTEVKTLDQQADGRWLIAGDGADGSFETLAKFVFIGAGGAALSLLQKSGIDEVKGYGGFPISGQWLVCTREDIVNQHDAKIYGKAAVGAPPMSVPHLDTRFVNGKKSLIFGPYAGFTTKFLKKGSLLDLPLSVRPNNLLPLLQVGAHNFDLTRYLISEATQSMADRMQTLRNFYPEADEKDWSLAHAGKRVQIIKKDAAGKGKLEFGTEVVASKDRSIAALMGASPGASTSVDAMLQVLERCFPEQMQSESWKKTLAEWVPSYKVDLNHDPELTHRLRQRSLGTLGLI